MDDITEKIGELVSETEKKKESIDFLVGKAFFIGLVVGGIAGLIVAVYVGIMHCG